MSLKNSYVGLELDYVLIGYTQSRDATLTASVKTPADEDGQEDMYCPPHCCLLG